MNTITKGNFTIRVYGLCINPITKNLLVSDEIIQEKKYTKLPGGGLEFGEGLRAALKRECFEELGITFEVLEHFYTCDFFQESLFHHSPTQVIAVYYFMQPNDWNLLNDFVQQSSIGNSNIIFDKKEFFYWLPIQKVYPDKFSFPIDKIAIEKLMNILTDKK